MTVECEEFEFCKVKVHYTADSDLVREKRSDALNSVKKMNVKVPGFRQKNKFKNSKAYEVALKKAYKTNIERQVQSELVSEAYDEVLFETKMKPIGYPQISFANLDEETFECDMVFLKQPNFELKEYKDFKIPRPHQNYTPMMYAERSIQELRKRHSEVVIYNENDFLQEGDQVTMDVKATSDDNEVASLTKAGLAYTVGQNTFKEFDYNIYGMKPGETRSFDIVFPDSDEINADIKNKKVNFNVTLHMGTKLMLCAADDEFAKKLGFDSFAELHNEAIGSASAQLEKEQKQLIINQVLLRILSCHDFDVPSWLVLMESQKAAQGLGIDWNKMTDSDIINLNKQSTSKIKLSMILDSVRDNEPDAVFSDEEILNKIRSNIKDNGGNPDEVLSSAQKDGSLFGLVAKLKDEATIQWLVSKSSIIDDEVTTNAETEKTSGPVDSGFSE